MTERKKSFENNVGKGENAGDQYFLLFPKCFYFIRVEICFFNQITLLSANVLSVDQAQILSAVGGFGKKSCVSTGMRKPGNICITDRHDMNLSVKAGLNHNTTNQPTNFVIW